MLVKLHIKHFVSLVEIHSIKGHLLGQPLPLRSVFGIVVTYFKRG